MRNKKRGYAEMMEIYILNAADCGNFECKDVGIYDDGHDAAPVSNRACFEAVSGDIGLSMIEMAYGLDNYDNPYNWVDRHNCSRVAYDAVRAYRRLHPGTGPMPR